MNNNAIQNKLIYTTSWDRISILKASICFLLIFLTITTIFLTLSIYTQNLQIQELLYNLIDLHTQKLYLINENFTVLVNEKNYEISELKKLTQHLQANAQRQEFNIIKKTTFMVTVSMIFNLYNRIMALDL
jgi:hypothetical protein